MREIDILTQNVIRGFNAHQIVGSGACSTCPYYGKSRCSASLMSDAIKVIDYWKGKYESTLLATPPMILNVNQEPSIIKVESADIQKVEKYTKAMKKAGNAAKFATEALRETTQALRELKEELDNG